MENKSVVQKRQIVIETDGTSINLVKAEITSLLEFTAIINQLSDFVRKQMQLAAEESSKKEEKEPRKEEKVVESAK